ncbi:MAG TPA: hypothetical protein VEU96_25700 [Bryobacteraceae bacterium]|nr:hypothetical protein [Bryobacteraceae bacterium]
MYRLLRNIHLTLALLALPFLLIYAFSSVQMIHGFRQKPQVVETRVTASSGAGDARRLARELMDRFGLRGELQQIFTTPAGSKLHIVRPGTVYEVEYTSATGETVIRTSSTGFPGLLSQLHRAAGFWHQYWLINLWSGLVAWTSIAIILLGISGVWMWFLRGSERVAGIVLLALNLGSSLTLLFLIRFP